MNHSVFENAPASASDRLPLFRPEVSGQPRGKLYGEIILLRPVSLTLFLWLAVAFIGSAVTFLAFAHYTNKARVSGILSPDRGLVRIFAPHTGTMLACHVRNGQRIRKGDVLFEITSDRSILTVKSFENEIRRGILESRQSLIQERAGNLKLSLVQAQGLRDRLDKIDRQQIELAGEITTAEKRLALAERIFEKYRQLGNENLISALELQQKESEPLEQRKVLQELHRSQIALAGERSDIDSQLQRLPSQTQLQSKALDRSISQLETQLSEHEATHRAVVRAPADGMASAVVDQPGITVEPTNALATLLPAQAKLEAHLYAPSREVGLIKAGQQVLLRYEAYPSERFGQHTGVVLEISQVALSPAEYAFRTGGTAQESMYEIIVSLPSQAITIYGHAQELRAGMAIGADVVLERRSLLEWLFSPVLRFKGRLAG